MARTLVRNLTASPHTLPPPYSGILPPGGAAILGDDETTVIRNLGGASVVQFLEIRPVSAANQLTEHAASGAGYVYKNPVRVRVAVNVALAAPGAALDGVAMAVGDRFFAAAQTAPVEGGVYVWNGAAVPATRAADVPAGSNAHAILFTVDEGTSADQSYACTNNFGADIVGTSTLVFRQESQLLSAVAPANVTKAAAAIGTSGSAARADHKHDVDTAVVGGITIGDVAAEGAATSLARSDHVHAMTAPAAPANVTKAAAGAGAATTAARADHKHDVDTAAPADTGAANAEGAATSLARSDHVHAIGNGTLTAIKDAAADADGLSSMAVIRYAIPAAGGGAPDDVMIYTANAPFQFRVLDAVLYVSTVVALSTVTLRDAAGGGGSALTDALSSATTGVKRSTALTATGTVAAGGSLAIRRSDNGVAGELVVVIQRV